MERIYNSTLQQKLEDYITAGTSQEETARQIGLSGGLLSAYRKSNYNGSIKNVEIKLAELFAVEAEGKAKREKDEPYKSTNDYVETSISASIYKTIRYCQLEKGMCVIHGDAGIGKTKAAGKYARDNPSLAIYLQASPVIGALGGFLKALACTLHIDECKSKFDLIQSIKERMEGTNRVLIIDEAQHLQYRALEEIRTWGDVNEVTGRGGIGIVLIGNSEVYNRMLGKQEARFAQLFSRVKFPQRYSTRDITKADTEMLFPILKGSSTEKEFNLIYGICQSRWGVRGAVNVYNNAVNNGDVTYNGMFAMARKMGMSLIQ